VGRDLDESAVVEQRDPVGPRGRRQPVGDGDHRSPGRDGGQRALDGRFRGRVEARGGLVQDDHRRIGQRDPRERDELPFSGGEPDAAGLDVGGEAAREHLEPLERPDRLEGALDVVVRGVGPREPHVVGDRAREEVPLLRHEDDPAAQLREADVAQVDAAERHRALIGVVGPHEELRQGRLARAGLLGRLGDVDRRLEQTDDLRQRGAPRLELAEPVAEPRDRVEEAREVEHERGEHAGADVAAPVEPRAGDEHRRGGHGLRDRDRREEADVDVGRVLPCVDLGAAAALVARQLILLAAERLDHPDARQPFLERGHLSATRSRIAR
jgi:hypothetical protein